MSRGTLIIQQPGRCQYECTGANTSESASRFDFRQGDLGQMCDRLGRLTTRPSGKDQRVESRSIDGLGRHIDTDRAPHQTAML